MENTKMTCPKCGEEMQPGYLQTGTLVAFNKEIHKISLLPKDPEDELIYQEAFTAANFAGHICKACGLVLFDYKNPVKR